MAFFSNFHRIIQTCGTNAIFETCRFLWSSKNDQFTFKTTKIIRIVSEIKQSSFKILFSESQSWTDWATEKPLAFLGFHSIMILHVPVLGKKFYFVKCLKEILVCQKIINMTQETHFEKYDFYQSL